MSNEAVFKDAPVRKAVMHMAVPSIIASLVLVVYNIADTFFVGQTNDALQVAAVSFSNSVFILYMAAANIIGIGGSALISILLGESKGKDAKSVSSLCCWASVGVGIVFGVLVIAFMEPLIRFLGCSSDSFAFTRDYLFYIALGSPFVVFSTAFGHVVRGEGAAKASMLGGLVGTVVNIILDPILILAFHWGTAGAAIATVIGNIVASGCYCYYIIRKSSVLSLHPKFLASCKGIIKRVTTLGLPAGANAALSGIDMLLLIQVLSGYGEVAVAGMGIVTKSAMLIEMTQSGIANGILPLLGYNYGAKNMPRFKAVLKTSFIITCGFGVIVSAAYLLAGGGLIRLFINDADVIAKGTPMLMVLTVSGPAYGVLFLCTSALQALERSAPATAISLCRQGFFFIPLLYILNALFGFNGAISVQATANFLSAFMAVVLLWRAFKGLRKTSTR
jgi:putative MATE family efflux protein